jgi:predicted Zn finger-like uncharacterized protein
MNTLVGEKSPVSLNSSEPIQCPRCHTQYELGAAELALADGWVRCGECDQVFFAPVCSTLPQTPADGLMEIPHDAQPVGHRQENPGQESKESPKSQESQESQEEHRDSKGALTPPEAGAGMNDVSLALPSVAMDSSLEGRPLGAEQALNQTKEVAPSLEIYPSDGAKPEPVIEQENHASLQEGTRDQDGSKPARSRIQGRLYVWVVVLTLLGAMGLATLEIYRSRHVIAALWPELKPWMQTFCEPFACTLEVPRDLQALSIETSALDSESDQAHHFVLSLKLRNHNAYPVATPWIKLLILNEQEQIVMQKEFELSQYAKSSTLEPGVITPWTIPVVLEDSIDDKLAAGYRVELLDKP